MKLVIVLEIFNSIKEELIQYCNFCINDTYITEYEDYISCNLHKLACNRFLNDLKRIGNDDFPYIWDEVEAQKIVTWFQYLRHSKGELSGQPIVLNSWQKFNLCQIYGWKHKDTGYKRFTKSFCEVARKNAKSQIESGVVLYEMSTQSTKNKELYECYCAGTKKEQSKVIFEECKAMLKGSPLATKFKINRDKIIHIKTGSFIRPLNKEDGKKGDGSNPALLVLDEYHQHATTEFYDLFAGANTKESLLMIITTAGMDLTFPCYTQEYKYCSRVLKGEIINDSYFVDILEVEKDDDINDVRVWKKANPIRMTYEGGVKKVKDFFEVAKEVPDKMVTFMTKYLNIWVQSKENGYMPMNKWDECIVKEIDKSLLIGKPCYVGFDMSAKIDLTSVAFIILVGEKYYLFSHSFCPSYEALRMHEITDKQPFMAWHKQGFISVTNSPIVDQQQVLDYVEKFCEELKVKVCGYWFDPTNASKMMTDLQNEKPLIDIVEVFQSHKALNECTAGFREQVFCGNIIAEYNPVLNFAMTNAIVKINNGLIKIDKDATNKRIDPVDATLCAFKGAMYHEEITYNPLNALEDMSKDW